MYYRRFSPFSAMEEMNRLQRDINRLFGASPVSQFSAAPAFPPINVWTSEESAVLTAELPGVDIDDINISVVGETLTLSGERKDQQPEGELRYHRQERGFGKFTRSITLPFPVQADNVDATLEKGVLTITLPRAEADKPRKIMVKNAR